MGTVKEEQLVSSVNGTILKVDETLRDLSFDVDQLSQIGSPAHIFGCGDIAKIKTKLSDLKAGLIACYDIKPIAPDEALAQLLSATQAVKVQYHFQLASFQEKLSANLIKALSDEEKNKLLVRLYFGMTILEKAGLFSTAGPKDWNDAFFSLNSSIEAAIRYAESSEVIMLNSRNIHSRLCVAYQRELALEIASRNQAKRDENPVLDIFLNAIVMHARVEKYRLNQHDMRDLAVKYEEANAKNIDTVSDTEQVPRNC